MKNKSLTCALLVILSVISVSCSSTVSNNSDASSEKESRIESPSPEEAPVEKLENTVKVDYIDPSVQDSYCGILKDFKTLSEQAAKQSPKDSLAQLGERLELFSKTAESLSAKSPGMEFREQWSEVAKKYKAATDFYMSTGGQLQDTDFIALLGEAVASSNVAYEAQNSHAANECSVKLESFIGEK